MRRGACAGRIGEAGSTRQTGARARLGVFHASLPGRKELAGIPQGGIPTGML